MNQQRDRRGKQRGRDRATASRGSDKSEPEAANSWIPRGILTNQLAVLNLSKLFKVCARDLLHRL